MSDVYENIPVHLVPYSCDNLVANAKKHPKTMIHHVLTKVNGNVLIIDSAAPWLHQ